MAENFLTFQKFNDQYLAEQIADKLRQGGINFLIENNQKIFDPSFANTTVNPDISIKLKASDFSKAHKALDDYYKEHLENVDKNYYLFEFTDEELIEIISKPDEWGHFDYQLAQKILKERGKEIKPEIAEALKANRIKELAKPETTPTYWIYIGYFSAILGGLFGIIIGASLAYYKKTLPDGQRVYAYPKSERNHGITMLIISIVSFAFWIIVRSHIL